MAMETKKNYETKTTSQKIKPDIKRVKSTHTFKEDFHSPSASKKANPWKRKQTRDTSKTHQAVEMKKEKGNINNHKSPKHHEVRGKNQGENIHKRFKAAK